MTPSQPSQASAPSMDRQEEIAAGLAAVRARIDAARAAAGRADAVTLVVVTKTFPASDVAILAELGVTDVGENRDQEASAKRLEVGGTEVAGAPAAVSWHMIGQLQRNKVASVARWADVVESVDRPAVAIALGRAAVAAQRTLDVLLQVALDVPLRDDRGGIAPDEALGLAEVVAEQPGLTLRGVMGVAPYPPLGDPQASAAQAFARLREVSRALQGRWPGADRISAGMSDDLEEAVAHGATQVRIGGAVLGHRTYVQ